MASKRPNPLRGPLLTLALMLGSVALVVAVATFVDAHAKPPHSTVAATSDNATQGQRIVR
jgi:hypothetical protein